MSAFEVLVTEVKLVFLWRYQKQKSLEKQSQKNSCVMVNVLFFLSCHDHM